MMKKMMMMKQRQKSRAAPCPGKKAMRLGGWPNPTKPPPCAADREALTIPCRDLSRFGLLRAHHKARGGLLPGGGREGGLAARASRRTPHARVIYVHTQGSPFQGSTGTHIYLRTQKRSWSRPNRCE